MTPLDHLVAVLVQLEEQAQEIEHRQSFIRSAIESFGIDADDALLAAMRGKDVAPHASATAEWMGRDVGFDLSPAATVEPDAESPPPPAPRGPQPGRENERLTPEADDLVGLSYRVPGTKQWNWELIAEEIEIGDIIGTRRTKHLRTVLGVSAATAQWMVKRCRELSLIDVERPKFDQQKARDAAAAAI